MKKIFVSILIILGVAHIAEAQSIYEAEKLMSKDLSGTARFVGMGGALGALGADISTMGVNPAGIGLYRKYDFSGTLSYGMNETKSDFFGNQFNNNKNKFNFSNLGFVVSTQIGGDVLKYVNFGFNYNRVVDFNSRMNVNGNMGAGQTVTNQMAAVANAMPGNVADADFDGKDSPYFNPNYGWLGLVGCQGNLINLNNDGKYESHFLDAQSTNFMMRESGGISQYDFNIALNLSNRVFLGATLGVYDVNYKNSIYYRENFENAPSGDLEYMSLDTHTSTEGTGVDFKLGAIVRPFENSPFRLGIAVHTPVFYSLTRYTNFVFQSDVYGVKDGKEGILETDVDSYDNYWYGYDNEFDYKLQSPWKLNLSAGHNVGTFLALGAEYEYQDYSTSKFKYRDGYGGHISDLEEDAKGFLKKVHTIRLGAEFKVIPEFAFRLGYNYQTASFSKESYRYVMPNSRMTDTHYFNKDQGKNTFTIGAGYMGKMFYTDLAFKYDTYKTKFKPYDGTDLLFSSVTNNKSTVMFTFGVRL